jgi:hypothetical protein
MGDGPQFELPSAGDAGAVAAPQTEGVQAPPANAPDPTAQPESGITGEQYIDLSKVRITQQDLALARAEIEMEQGRGQQPQFDPRMLADAFSNAVKPLVPKPPSPPRMYEKEDWLATKENLVAGIKELFQSEFERWQEENYNPYKQRVDQMAQFMPMIYARSMENPQFGAIRQRANEIANKWGIDPSTALAMAQDEIGKRPMPSARTPPPHASTPNTRQNTAKAQVGDVVDGSGSDFKSIFADLRKAGKI